jgi:excisionase family DNA binding protein
MSLIHSTLPTLMTFREVMEVLRVSRSTVYRLVWSGALVAYKISNSWRFIPDDVQACLKRFEEIGDKTK